MASKIVKGITIEIGGNTTKLGEAIKECESQARSLQGELREVDKLLKVDPGNTELLTQKQKLLRDAISETADKLKILKDAEEQAQKQFEKGEITEEQYRALKREIESTEQKLKSLNKEIDNFGTVGAQKIAAVGETFKDVGAKIENAGQKLMPYSAAATGALVAVSKTAIDFETAWTGVTKTVDGTEEQLANIKQGILDLSQETASSATDIAAVAEAAGQLGISTDSILEFTKTMVMLGDSTNLSSDEAASALAKFANITQMSSSDYGKLGSVIVALGNNFATTEADIVSMATRLASTGEVTGLTEPQIMALSTALSSAGIEAEAGGSAMAKLLKQMYSTNAEFDTASKVIDQTGYSLRDLQLMQSLDSKGFKELAGSLGLTTTELSGAMKSVDMMNKYASTAGVSVKEFRKAYGQDAVAALSLFVQGLNDTERNGQSAVEILNEMGLTEVRLSNAVLAMASSGDLMTSAVELANNAWNENNALATEAGKRYETTAAKISQIKGQFTELATKLGDILIPVIQNVIDKVGELLDWFINLDPETQGTIAAIIGLFAIGGPLLIGIGNVVTAFGGVMTAVSSLWALINAHPIGALVTAAGLLVGAFILANEKMDEQIKKTWGLTEDEKKLNEEIEKRAEAIRNANDARDESSKKIEAETAHSKNLWKELQTIVDENGKIKTGYEERAEVITTLLAEALGIEIEIVDGQILKYGELKKTIDEVIRTKQAEALLDVHKSAYTEAITEQADAFTEYMTALDNVAASEERLAKARKNYDYYHDEKNRPSLVWATEEQLAAFSQQMIDSAKALDAATEAHEANTKAVETAEENYLNYCNTIARYEGLLGAVADGDVEKLNSAISELSNNFKTSETASKKMLENQLADFKTQYENLKNAVKQGMPGVTQEQVDQMAKLIEKAEAEIRKLEPKMDESGKKSGINFANGIGSTFPRAYEAGVLLADGTSTGLNTLDNYGIGSDLGGNYVEGLRAKLEEAKSAGDSLGEKTGDGLRNLDADKIGSDTGSKYGNGIVRQGSAVENAGKTLAIRGKTGFESVDTRKAGEDFADGFSSGVSNKIPSLIDTARSLATSALNAIRGALDIRSPSREAAALGDYFAQGFTRGISDNHSAAVLEAESLANDTLSALEKTGVIDFGGNTIGDSVSATMENSSSSVLAKLDGIYERLNRLQIVLDTGTLVGETIDKIDAGLADKQLLSARGV